MRRPLTATPRLLVRTLAVGLLAFSLCTIGARTRGPAADAGAASGLRDTFDSRYAAFRARCRAETASASTASRVDTPEFRALVALGVPAIPLLVEKLQQEPDFVWTAWACSAITRVSGQPEVNPWAKEKVADWWNGGQRQADARFDAVHRRWREAKRRGALQEADALTQTMEALGLPALPKLVQKVEAGDAELLPLILRLTRGGAAASGDTPEERRSPLADWWTTDKKKWLIEFPDQRECYLKDEAPALSEGAAAGLSPASEASPHTGGARPCPGTG